MIVEENFPVATIVLTSAIRKFKLLSNALNLS